MSYSALARSSISLGDKPSLAMALVLYRREAMVPAAPMPCPETSPTTKVYL
jgi:hypothetical protein